MDENHRKQIEFEKGKNTVSKNNEDNTTSNKFEKEMPSIPMNMYEALQYRYEDRIDKLIENTAIMIAKEKEDKERAISGWKRACIASIITLGLLIGGLIGGAVYLLSNFEFATYTQDGSGVNNYNLGSQGDVSYEPNNPNVETQTSDRD